jgi:predicted Zn-dependent protease
LPGGYAVTQFKDSHLNAAAQLLEALAEEPDFNNSYRNLMYEMLGYIHLLQNDMRRAKEYYTAATRNKEETFPVSWNRATEMMNRNKTYFQ